MLAALLLAPAAPVFAETPVDTEAHASALVDGFRSASFGMTEADVRSAISKDFKVKNDVIVSTDNSVEETHTLSVEVPDLLPNGGRAKVTYILGAKTKKLIEVNITWAATTDPAVTAPTLTRNAELLSNYFRAQAFKPDAVQTNLMLNNGSLLLFRGADAKGHLAVLILESEASADKAAANKRTPKSLLLSYIADPKNPDVFKLPAGSF